MFRVRLEPPFHAALKAVVSGIRTGEKVFFCSELGQVTKKGCGDKGDLQSLDENPNHAPLSAKCRHAGILVPLRGWCRKPCLGQAGSRPSGNLFSEHVGRRKQIGFHAHGIILRLFVREALHLLLGIGLDIVSYHNDVEGFDHPRGKVAAVLVDELNVPDDVVFSSNLFFSNRMSYLFRSAKDSILIPNRNRF